MVVCPRVALQLAGDQCSSAQHPLDGDTRLQFFTVLSKNSNNYDLEVFQVTKTSSTESEQDSQLDSKTSFYWPMYRKCCSDHSKEIRPKSPERKINFYTFYKVLMLLEPSASSKTNVGTTSGLRMVQSLPKGSGGGAMITRLGVTVAEENPQTT